MFVEPLLLFLISFCFYADYINEDVPRIRLLARTVIIVVAAILVHPTLVDIAIGLLLFILMRSLLVSVDLFIPLAAFYSPAVFLLLGGYCATLDKEEIYRDLFLMPLILISPYLSFLSNASIVASAIYTTYSVKRIFSS